MKLVLPCSCRSNKACWIAKHALLLMAATFLTQALISQTLNSRNLDFELAGKGNLFPWQKPSYSKARYHIQTDSTRKHSGSYSLRVSFDTVSKGISDGAIFMNIGPDVPGKQVKVSAWVYQDTPLDTAGSISLIVSQDAGERRTSVRGRSIVKTHGWTSLSWEMSLDSFHFPLHHLRLNILGIGTGSFWVDGKKRGTGISTRFCNLFLTTILTLITSDSFILAKLGWE